MHQYQYFLFFSLENHKYQYLETRRLIARIFFFFWGGGVGVFYGLWTFAQYERDKVDFFGPFASLGGLFRPPRLPPPLSFHPRLRAWPITSTRMLLDYVPHIITCIIWELHTFVPNKQSAPGWDKFYFLQDLYWEKPCFSHPACTLLALCCDNM